MCTFHIICTVHGIGITEDEIWNLSIHSMSNSSYQNNSEFQVYFCRFFHIFLCALIGGCQNAKGTFNISIYKILQLISAEIRFIHSTTMKKNANASLHFHTQMYMTVISIVALKNPFRIQFHTNRNLKWIFLRAVFAPISFNVHAYFVRHLVSFFYNDFVTCKKTLNQNHKSIRRIFVI